MAWGWKTWVAIVLTGTILVVASVATTMYTYSIWKSVTDYEDPLHLNNREYGEICESPSACKDISDDRPEVELACYYNEEGAKEMEKWVGICSNYIPHCAEIEYSTDGRSLNTCAECKKDYHEFAGECVINRVCGNLEVRVTDEITGVQECKNICDAGVLVDPEAIGCPAP